MTRRLLIFTAAAEAGFGLLLFAAPAVIIRLLFDMEFSGPAITVGRFADVGLVVLGVACWPRGESRGAFYGMLAWSVLAIVLLIIAGMSGRAGILLWPAVAVHAAIAVLLLWSKRAAA